MKKIILLFIIILGFISIFYYENRDFIHANSLNNSGILYYNSGSYGESIDIFSGALLHKQNNIILFNKGNSYYKIGESNNDINKKIDYYTQAIESYSGSLGIHYNQDVQENYDFVQNKLDELLKPQETEDKQEESEKTQETEDNQEESSSEKNNQESDQNSDNTQGEEQEGEEGENTEEGDDINNENNPDNGEQEGEGSESDSSENNNLSDEEKKQIEKYAEDLKKSEFYNQEYFNKQQPEQDENIDDFFRDPFFDDSFSRGGKKDW